MAGRRHRIASRVTGVAQLARWPLLVLLGVVVGAVLGDLAAGNRLGRASLPGASYAELSANPDAATADSQPASDCPGCADSYGVAVRLRAERATREDDAYRELGAVELDWPVPMPEDDYRYGGRFPEPDPAADRADPPAEVAAADGVPVAETLPTD